MNIAPATVFMSSGHSFANCADGNLNNYCHSGHEVNPWLALTFASPIALEAVRIYNRQDCCQQRLGQYTVSLQQAGSSTWVECASATVPCIGQGNGDLSAACSVFTHPCQGMSVMAVRVQITSNGVAGYLNLAEYVIKNSNRGLRGD